MWAIPQILPLGLRYSPPSTSLVTSTLELNGDRLVATGTAHVREPARALFAVQRDGEPSAPLNAAVSRGQPLRTFVVEIDLAWLVEHSDCDDALADANLWFPHMVSRQGPVPLACERSLPQPTVEVDGRKVSVFVDERHNLLVAVQRSVAGIGHLRWEGGGGLTIQLDESPTSQRTRGLFLRARLPGGRVAEHSARRLGSPPTVTVTRLPVRVRPAVCDRGFAPPLRVEWVFLVDTDDGPRAAVAAPSVFRSLPAAATTASTRVSFEERRRQALVLIVEQLRDGIANGATAVSPSEG